MGKENQMSLQESYRSLDFSENYPYPYQPENFSEKEKEVLDQFFTNTDKPIFAIHGLPQEVVGAMFSRYSRMKQSVRRVFLDEFWKSPELGIQNIITYLSQEGEDFEKGRERANSFYKRVFAEYGDDSVIQMGSVHVAFEGVSQIAAKAIEDARIGAAYIEKSTRYVDFGSKANGHYLFTEVPEIMQSDFKNEFLEWNESLFDAYVKHLPNTIEFLRTKYPLEAQVFTNPKIGKETLFSEIKGEEDIKKAKEAYKKALEAKAFDTVRVFLPTTTVTNMGAHFSGQAAENAINKLLSSQHQEVRTIGLAAFGELSRVAPNFLQNIDHRYGEITRKYLKRTRSTRTRATHILFMNAVPRPTKRNRVKLVDWDKEADTKIVAQLLYTGQDVEGWSKESIFNYLKTLKEKEGETEKGSSSIDQLLLSLVEDRTLKDLNRRHKLPRAFEHAFAEVEFNVDFGIYRDLQRNRMSSTERTHLTAKEVFIPPEFEEEGMEEVLNDYLELSDWTKELNEKLVKKGLGYASEYVTMLGNKLRFNIRANLRQWVFFSELRTIPGGHPTYRKAMQVAARQIIYVMPFMKKYFAHVDWKKDYGLGRLSAEIKTQDKLEKLSSKK